MDVVAELEKALNEAERRWRTSGELVLRLEVLRTLHRRIHELKNEELAGPAGSSHTPGPARTLNDELAPLPDHIESLPPSRREHTLRRALSLGLMDWVRESLGTEGSSSSPNSPSAAEVVPQAVAGSGREWERLVWRGLMQSPGWRIEHLREDVDLREFAEKAAAREAEHARRGVVLGVRCLTFQGMMRTWEWSLIVRQNEHPEFQK